MLIACIKVKMWLFPAKCVFVCFVVDFKLTSLFIRFIFQQFMSQTSKRQTRTNIYYLLFAPWTTAFKWDERGENKRRCKKKNKNECSPCFNCLLNAKWETNWKWYEAWILVQSVWLTMMPKAFWARLLYVFFLSFSLFSFSALSYRLRIGANYITRN